MTATRRATTDPLSGMGRRIVFVTNGNPIGGAETQLLRLAAHLHASGDRVLVLSLLPNPHMVERLAAAGIPIATAPLGRRLRGVSAVAWATARMRAWRPDAVIAFVYQSVIVGRVAARLAGVPVVISSIRNEWIGGRHRDLLARLTDRLADVTVVNSELAGRSLAGRGAIETSRCRVVPNGIELGRYGESTADRDVVREQLGVGGGAFVWLAAGRLVPQKDYKTMLAAFERVAGDRDTRLLIAGDGPLRAALEQWAASAGMSDLVRVLGHRDDMPALLQAADALVMSSSWEGLPNVVIEALASARPVVATAVGGVPELLEEGSTGHLVAPGDVAALADAMSRLMETPAPQRETMGASARAAVGRFDWTDVASRWSSLIDEQLAGARKVVAR